jgi:hypothetical protein
MKYSTLQEKYNFYIELHGVSSFLSSVLNKNILIKFQFSKKEQHTCSFLYVRVSVPVKAI